MSETYSHLQAMSRAELVEKHDRIAGQTVAVPNDYLDQLARLDAKEQGERMEGMTATMRNLTWVIVFLTLINVGAALVQVLPIVEALERAG